jgi:hypothetical protein
MNHMNAMPVLRSVLGQDAETAQNWTPDELGMILDHQMSTNISDEEAVCSIDRSIERTNRAMAHCACTSYREFFICNSEYCVEITARVKAYAKYLINVETSYPRDVAKFVYLMAILRAKRTRMGEITNTSDKDIKRQVRKYLTMGWLSDESRKMLRNTSAFLFGQ